MTEHVRRYAAGALGIAPPADMGLLGPAEHRQETVADHAVRLYDAARAGTLALSDRKGVMLMLGDIAPDLSVADCEAAQRLATDLLQRRARSADRLIASQEAALAMAEDVAEGATDADLHAVLAQLSDLLASTLSHIPD